MGRDSLAVAIEALSWMAYAGIGERTALFKAAAQLDIKETSELRQAHRLVMESTRYQNRLQYLISSVTDSKQIQEAPHGITSFMKILAYLSHVAGATEPEVKRHVKWARQILGWKELQPFEMAIARIAYTSSQAPPPSLSEVEKIALETCHPTWFVHRTIRIFGRRFALRMLRRNLSPLPTYVRMNPLKFDQDDRALSDAKRKGWLRFMEMQDVWKVVGSGRPLVRSAEYASGRIVIQDLASITTGLVVSPKPGARVLDICAAPGNKTSHLAALMQNRGEIFSIDISGRRMSHWLAEMNRTGVSIAQPICSDATTNPLRIEADAVLVDPPCSNTGVFARNPSIKWRTTPHHIREFTLRQYSLISAGAGHVAPGGTLTYCTCSILPEENESVVEAFLKRNHDFRLTPQQRFIGSAGLLGFDSCQRFYPHLHDCNGYFIAKMQKTS